MFPLLSGALTCECFPSVQSCLKNASGFWPRVMRSSASCSACLSPARPAPSSSAASHHARCDRAPAPALAAASMRAGHAGRGTPELV
eukprot:scaffold57779_cov30-Tisochrysis_lutea.AAC.10